MFTSGHSLFKKLSVALPDSIIQRRAFHAFTKGIRAEHNDVVDDWERMVLEWEADHSKSCPYEFSRGKILTFDDVKKQLAEEEHACLVKDKSVAVEDSPSAFIIEGLRIEEAQ